MDNARLLDELRQGTEELTRRQAALRNSEERYALAMRAINEGVYEWDVVTSEMYSRRHQPRRRDRRGLFCLSPAVGFPKWGVDHMHQIPC